MLSPSRKDDTAAIQAAYDSAAPGGVIELAAGQYTVSVPLIMLDKPVYIRARNAVLNWRGKAGVCLTAGFSPKSTVAGSTAGAGWGIEGLSINHPSISEPIIDNTSVGLVWQNVVASKIHDILVSGFGTGMQLIGDGAACAYNDVFVRGFNYNGTSLQAIVRDSGYVNENTFYGGNWVTGPSGIDQPWGHLNLQGMGASAFIRCCFQIGVSPATIWAQLTGCTDIMMLNCRWESTQGRPFILDKSCQRCRLRGATSNYVLWQDAVNHMTTNVFDPNW